MGNRANFMKLSDSAMDEWAISMRTLVSAKVMDDRAISRRTSESKPSL